MDECQLGRWTNIGEIAKRLENSTMPVVRQLRGKPSNTSRIFLSPMAQLIFSQLDFGVL